MGNVYFEYCICSSATPQDLSDLTAENRVWLFSCGSGVATEFRLRAAGNKMLVIVEQRKTERAMFSDHTNSGSTPQAT
jgi:hypothetical protein